MKDTIKLGLAEDHNLLRNTLVNMLSAENGVSVIFDVANGQDLLNKLKKTKVDVILLDLDMPIMDGRDALKIIKKQHPDVKVLILSMHYTDLHIQKLIALGANGYLSKGCEFDELLAAIQDVYHSDFYFDEKVTPEFIQKLLSERIIVPKFVEHDPISKREVEVLKLICTQKTSLEIAKELEISVRTVENHRKTLMIKTGARNGVGLLAYAISNGFYSLKI